MNVRLSGLFSLRSPLSHIGETISTTAYLVQQPVLQLDGTLEEIFVYAGNAWRGQLRDLAASYLLDALGAPRLPLDTFHLLYSGGRIGGEQVTDIARARAWRQSIPPVAVWGGGVGNQVLPGKLRVSNAYPLCREAIPCLPATHHAAAATISYRGLTFEQSFSRVDDGKDERLRPRLAEGPVAPAQGTLLEGPAPAKKEREGPADQMRMTVELLAAGVRLATELELLDASEVELGCLVSALHRFSVSPHIGGQAGKGHGRVDVEYAITDLDTGETRPFLAVSGGRPLLAPPAAAAKDAYDQHLRALYDAMLAERGGEITALLGVGT